MPRALPAPDAAVESMGDHRHYFDRRAVFWTDLAGPQTWVYDLSVRIGSRVSVVRRSDGATVHTDIASLMADPTAAEATYMVSLGNGFYQGDAQEFEGCTLEAPLMLSASIPSPTQTYTLYPLSPSTWYVVSINTVTEGTFVSVFNETEYPCIVFRTAP